MVCCQCRLLLWLLLLLLLLLLPSAYGTKRKQATSVSTDSLSEWHAQARQKTGVATYLLNQLSSSCLGATSTLPAGSDPLGTAKYRDPHLRQSVNHSASQSVSHLVNQSCGQVVSRSFNTL